MSNDTPSVPFNDLSRSAADLWLAAAPRWERALRDGWVVLGTGVRTFETEFSSYLGGGHVVGVASGTDALEVALRSVGVQQDSAVVLAANAGFYTSTALRAIGARPIYVDVADDVTPSADLISAVLDRADAGAVVVTHLYGRVCPDIAEIAAICRSRDVRLIEDCSQSHGARRDGTMSGTFGDAAAFSFYPTKNLGALGDAGALFTRDGEIESRARALRQYGWSHKYHVELSGGRNSRLDEVQAIVLSASLTSLDRRNARRRQVVDTYRAAAPEARFLAIDPQDDAWVAHLCVLEVDDRDGLRDRLGARGVSTDVHFPVADHEQAVWAGLRHDRLPRTEALARRVLSVPCFPEMSDTEIEHVATALAQELA